MPHDRAGRIRRAGKIGGIAGIELIGVQPRRNLLRLLPPALGQGRILLPLDAPLRVVRALPMPHQQVARLPTPSPPPSKGRGGDSDRSSKRDHL